jgi:maltose alpha-D-glucosyltransferase/alpha-amylase
VTGPFGPEEVSVAGQLRTPDSLMSFVSKLMHQRRETPELGWGASTLIENEPPALFAHRSQWQGSTVFAVHNLADEDVAAELELGEEVVGVEDLLERREHHVQGGRLRVELAGYGYLWLRARAGG